MLNESLHLSKKIFSPDIEQKTTRAGYGTGLVEAGERDPNVVALCADLTESTQTEAFAKKFPDRFFEVGVAEQNMVTIAAGLGVSGKIPFVASYATFAPGRAWEQIRTTISYNDSNVKIAGHHAGISVGPDGATHQAVEDIATMRVMANMKVFIPADANQAHKATLAVAKILGPVYLRFQRAKTPLFTTAATPFMPGKLQILWDSSKVSTNKKPQVAIIGCGALVYNALLAARELEKHKIGAIVANCHTIKPLDEDGILNLAKKTGAIVSVEEHQVSGGLGGAIAELLARELPTPMEFIGLQNVFGESGSPEELIEKYGMGVKHIIHAARAVIRKK